MKKNRKAAAAVSAVLTVMMLAGCGESTSPPAQTETSVQAQTADAQDTQSDVSESSADEDTRETADAEPADITAEIIANVEMSSLAEVGSDRLGNYLEIDPEKIDSFSMYICGSGGFADEVAVFRMKDEADMQELTDAVNARIESRSADFKDYNADEYDKLRHASVRIRGKYLLLAVCGDSDKAEEIFGRYIK